MRQYNNAEIEIDVKELIFVLLRKAWIIIFAGSICALGAGLVSYYALDPIYTSSTKIYVINRQNSEYTSYSDLQTSTQLTMDYKILVLSRPVTEQVIRELNLDMSHSDLVSSITVTAPEDTRILQIEVENTNPVLAKQLADSIAEVSAKRMVSVMEMEKVNVVEPGNLPLEPSSPSILKNTIIGGVAGGFVAAFLILFVYYMNDTIKSLEDVEKYLGLTTLGTLPLESKRRFVGKWFRRKKTRKVKLKRAGKKEKKEKNVKVKKFKVNKSKVKKVNREKAERLKAGTSRIVVPSEENESKTSIENHGENGVGEVNETNTIHLDREKADIELSVMIGHGERMYADKEEDTEAEELIWEDYSEIKDYKKRDADLGKADSKSLNRESVADECLTIDEKYAAEDGENEKTDNKLESSTESKTNAKSVDIVNDKTKMVSDKNIDIKMEESKLDFASSEAYKTLRTNILFCGKEVKTICITSCLPNEGKTVVSFRLAKTIAESGKKVLFIDADLRKSVIISRLKIEKAAYGLSQYLSGMNELEEVINKSNVENVDIIFTGPIPPNPSEMLGSDTFKELLKSQREIYDYIIIDTPPLGIVIDSANVAQACDGTIMVIESNNISYKLAQKVLSQLEKGKCRVLGAVLNKVEVSRKGYYGKAYGKYYGKYYGEYEIER